MADKEQSILDSVNNLEKGEEGSVDTKVDLTSHQKEELSKEIALEKKYGDSDLRTFTERAASSASFGLSDKALVEGARLVGGDEAAAKMQEGLRQRKERNEESAIAGDIAGIVAPTVLSGGSSLAAKGISAGVKGAAKAGLAAERATAKQLAKVLGETANKKIATEIIRKSIPKTAGSAVEGAFYGAGQLMSEDALGTAEFNAENLMSSVGTGAILGGVAGGALSTVQALIPVVKNNKIVDVLSKKINSNVDTRMAGAKLSKMTSSEIAKLKQTKWGEQIYDNIPKYFKSNLKLSALDSTEKLAKRSNAELKRIGESIGDVVKKIDDVAGEAGVGITRSQVARTVRRDLGELANTFRANPDKVAKDSLKKVERRIKSWDEWIADDSPISAEDLKSLKTNLQKVTKWNKGFQQMPLQGKLDRTVSESVRKEFLELADRASEFDSGLGEQLRQLNLDYGTSLVLSDKLNRAVDLKTKSSLLQFKDILLADVLSNVSGGAGLATMGLAAKKFAESDFRRKLVILTDIEKSNIKTTNKLNSSLKSFFKKSKKAVIPASTKVLMQSGSKYSDGKKPKNKQEAFSKISERLSQIVSNPVEFSEKISNSSLMLTGAAPETANALTTTALSAVNFLHEKMPKDPTAGTSLFNRKWQPSSLELAKFERYLAAVENPMSVLEDLEAGQLTREGVEALQSVYPDIYTRIQQKAVDEISENPDISYNKRIQVGLLLNIPADATLLPQNIMGLQQSFADEKQAQEAAVKGETEIDAPASSVNDINQSEDVKSQTERVITRE